MPHANISVPHGNALLPAGMDLFPRTPLYFCGDNRCMATGKQPSVSRVFLLPPDGLSLVTDVHLLSEPFEEPSFQLALRERRENA